MKKRGSAAFWMLFGEYWIDDDLFSVVKALASKAGQVKRCGRGNVALWAASHGKFFDFGKRLIHIAGKYLIPRLGGRAKDWRVIAENGRGAKPV